MDAAIHRPVLIEQVVAALAVPPGGLYVDGTVGLGGHAEAVLTTVNNSRVIGFDVDPAAMEHAHTRLAPFGDRATLIHAPYALIEATLAGLTISSVDAVLLDLGVSSLQIDTPSRGFSFRFDGPLDMRFSSAGPTAAELIAGAREEELVRILSEYGEEPRARRVARNVVRARMHEAITTTGQLRRIVWQALGGKKSKIDPATRTFQALRIATNRELDDLPSAIEGAVRCLRPAGRIAVISFHSLEDRIVKQTLRHLAGRCICPPGTYACQCNPANEVDILTTKPIVPDTAETMTNPRSRSAKLRIAARRTP